MLSGVCCEAILPFWECGQMFIGSCLLSFLLHLQNTCLGMVPPTVDWTLLYQLTIKSPTAKQYLCRPIWSGKFLNRNHFFLRWLQAMLNLPLMLTRTVLKKTQEKRQGVSQHNGTLSGCESHCEGEGPGSHQASEGWHSLHGKLSQCLTMRSQWKPQV